MRLSTVYAVLLSIGLTLGSVEVGVARSVDKSQRAAPGMPARQRIGEAPERRLQVTVRAYSPRRKETQGHPRDTASGEKVRPGIVALSPDVEKALGVEFGDRVVLEGLGTYVFHDRVASRKRRHVDIFMESTASARQFGKRQTHVAVPRQG